MADDGLLGLAPPQRAGALLGLGASPLDDPVIAGLQRLREQQWLFKPVAGADRNFGGIASPDLGDFIPKPGFDYGFLFPTRWPKGHPEAPRQWGYWPQIIRDPVTALADAMQGRLYDVNQGREDTAPSYVLPPGMTLALMGMGALGTKPAGAFGSFFRPGGRKVIKIPLDSRIIPETTVIQNPTKEQLQSLLARRGNAVRLIKEKSTSDRFAWPGYDETHAPMMRHLGIEENDIDPTGTGTWLGGDDFVPE